MPDFPQADILRLDKLDALVSGNKPLKLAGFFQTLKPMDAVLSFGGAHSNHLHALAYQAKLQGRKAILVVRGWPEQALSPTLQDCLDWGAKIIFADKKTYAKRYDLSYQAELAREHGAYVVPEGGSGELGELGCYSLGLAAKAYEEIWLACGSGATALGLAKGLVQQRARTSLVVVNAVADQGERRRAFCQSMPERLPWRLLDEAHLGGFGKTTAELLSLIQAFDAKGLALDPVYTAKLLLAFSKERALGVVRKTLLIHTGGLQGRRVLLGEKSF